MILFWLCVAVLLAFALAFVLPSLAGARRRASAADGDRWNVGVYRARLVELDEERRLGMLSSDDFEQAEVELARELLQDSGDPVPVAADDDQGNRRLWLTVAVAVAIPVATLALYQWLGEPRAMLDKMPPPVADAGPGHPGDTEMERMVAQLAERLRADPGNAQGWLLLGRSYMAMERYEQAALAFAHAHRLLGDDADLLTELAEAQALAEGQHFLGAPSEHLERALTLNPEHPKALWLGGFAAMQRGDEDLAVQRWRKLLAGQPEDSEAAQVLGGLIARVTGDREDSEPSVASTEAPGPVLRVTVSLDQGLSARVDGNETLFVFARAAEGPPMPLAVARRRAADLPLTVDLDDSMSMAPGLNLSSFASVVVVARISRSGTPTAQSGDLQGFSAPIEVSGTVPVTITISDTVP